MNVIEPIGYRGTVEFHQPGGLATKARRCHPTMRDSTTSRVDLDGIEPAIHVHHVFGYFTKGVRIIGTVCRWWWYNHGG